MDNLNCPFYCDEERKLQTDFYDPPSAPTSVISLHNQCNSMTVVIAKLALLYEMGVNGL